VDIEGPGCRQACSSGETLYRHRRGDAKVVRLCRTQRLGSSRSSPLPVRILTTRMLVIEAIVTDDRFHPAVHRAKSILDSGELGKIKNMSVTMTLPKGILNKGDIRFDYALGGGAMMDMGCQSNGNPLDHNSTDSLVNLAAYTLSCLRYLSSSNPTSVVEATPTLSPWSDQCDSAMTATLAFPNSVTGSLRADIASPYTIVPSMPEIRAVVDCEQGSLEMFNFIMPSIYHYIRVSKIDGGKKKTTGYKVYKSEDATAKGEEWWTTYRYQLEAFIDKVKGRTPQTWVSAEDSVTNIKWVEEVYAKVGRTSDLLAPTLMIICLKERVGESSQVQFCFGDRVARIHWHVLVLPLSCAFPPMSSGSSLKQGEFVGSLDCGTTFVFVRNHPSRPVALSPRLARSASSFSISLPPS
jgi:predicted dehydrogenase